MLAKDIMRSPVVTVAPFATLKELATLLDEHQISGCPVVDGDGGVLGVVSRADLVRAGRESGPRELVYHRSEGEEPTSSRGFHLEDPDISRVERIMTPGAISFETDAPVERIARLMLQRRVHRVLITRRGKLCGIVTTMDIVRAFLHQNGKKKPARMRAA